jgi:biopolymer transport protein ExbD
MRFPRNARILQGRLDAAPFATVLFLLVILLGLGSLVYTPGIRLSPPMAEELSGTDQPTLSVALDANGSLYFDNQWVEESKLTDELRKAVAASPGPLTLLVHADKRATYDMLLHLSMLARQAGITNSMLAALPGPFAGPPARSVP